MRQESLEQLEGGGHHNHVITGSRLVTTEGIKRDWSELLPEFLELIANNINLIQDYIRFSVVCKPWYSYSVSNRHYITRQILLMLLDQKQDGTRSFFRLYDGKTITIYLPQIHKKWCRAACQGWLMTFDENTKDLQLFNPFLNHSIQLPSMQTIIKHECDEQEHIHRYIYVQKFALSSDPILKPHDCVVMAIFSHYQRLAFCRLGDEKWTILNQLKEAETNIEDVIFYKQQFYVLKCYGGPLVAWNVLHGDPPQATIITRRTTFHTIHGEPDRRYLVDSCGELLIVVRFMKSIKVECNDCSTHEASPGDVDLYHSRDETDGFEAYKLQQETWTEVKCLGDQMLFLGDNCSLSLSARDYPVCKRNCIYFTDDYWLYYKYTRNFTDMGVYNLEDGKIETSFSLPPMLVKPAIWIMEDVNPLPL